MITRKLIAGLGLTALVLAAGCRSSTSYRQPVVVGTAPVAQPVAAIPAQAPCCNRPPVAAIPGPPPAGAQIPATVPPGAIGPYGR